MAAEVNLSWAQVGGKGDLERDLPNKSCLRDALDREGDCDLDRDLDRTLVNDLDLLRLDDLGSIDKCLNDSLLCAFTSQCLPRSLLLDLFHSSLF